MKRLVVLSCLACVHPPPPLPEPPLETGRPPKPIAVAWVDRTRSPPPEPEPVFHPPRGERWRLKNGLEVWLVEQHELPLVSALLVVRGVGAETDPEKLAGLSEIVADMLDEGSIRHTALELADELATLGATLQTDSDWDAAYVRMGVLRRSLDPAFGLFSDVVAKPTFAPHELERVRADRLARVLERRAEPRVVCGDVFAATVYGERHPYGRPSIGRATTLRAIRARHVRDLYRRNYRPDRATLVVAGDVTRAAIEPMLQKTLGAWKAAKPAPRLPAPTIATTPARLVVVDRPGSPQAEMRIGLASVPRTHPDHVALEVLNTVLGGTFSARLNHRLREELGFTYGTYSRFDFRRGAGPFFAVGAIKTQHTAEAVAEVLREIGRLRSDPVPDDELTKAKRNLTRSLASRFEASSDIASELADLAVHELPDDYFQTWLGRVERVTPQEVLRAAQAHLDPARIVIAVVGDRKVVEPGLEKLGRGPVELRDPEGRRLSK